MNYKQIEALIGKENETLLSHTCETVSKNDLHLPSPDFIDKVHVISNEERTNAAEAFHLFTIPEGLPVQAMFLFCPLIRA